MVCKLASCFYVVKIFLGLQVFAYGMLTAGFDNRLRVFIGVLASTFKKLVPLSCTKYFRYWDLSSLCQLFSIFLPPCVDCIATGCWVNDLGLGHHSKK